MASAAEKIGRLLVQRGLLTEEQLDSCLREHRSGGSSTLSDIIVSRGYTDAARLNSALDSVGALTLRCPEGCGKLSVKRPRLDAPYECKKCGALLEAEDPAMSWASTAESETPPEVAEASKDAKRHLGKYVLVKELGRGGSGSVYKAWDSILRQFVALKLIGGAGAGLAEDPNSKEVQEFLREARTAVKLSHPNIVRVYEVGCQDGRYYLSMELVEGGSLARLIHGKDASRRPKFYSDPVRFLSILQNTARALDYAHHQKPPIVHRDVKPHNILVDPSGRACLADFGLAREIGGGGRLTMTGVAKGTPCYMAPEQAKIHGNPLDGRTDVYGLGAILYEYLTGDPPFTGPSSHEILQKVISEDPVVPTQLLRSRNIPAIPPPALERIAFKALEKDPRRRYDSAAEFAADLERYLGGKGVEASAISPATRGVRWVARRRAIVLPAAIAVLMGIVALVAVLRSGGERVVERVVVQKEKVAGVETRFGEIDALAAGLRTSEALQLCDRLRAETKDAAALARLAQMADDLRLEQELLRGLVDRIRVAPRNYAKFALDGRTISPAEVVDAAMDKIVVAGNGMRSGYPWASVDPPQFIRLARDYWPDLDGKPALGLALWARRHHLDATVKSGESSDAQYFKLLSEGERALAGGELAVARGRFEKALELNRDGKEAKDGLDRVESLERKRAADRPSPPKPVAKPSDPDPVKVIENPRLSEECYARGNEHFEAGQYRFAVDDFSQAISYAEKKGNAYAMRGHTRYMLGEWGLARDDFNAAVSAGSWSDDYCHLYLWLCGTRIGQKTQATQTLRTFTRTSPTFKSTEPAWFKSLSAYLTDDLTEEQLIQLSADDSGIMKKAEKECEAWFYIGSKQLLLRQFASARKSFKKCILTGVNKFFEFKAAQEELDRLSDNPAANDPTPAPKPDPAPARPAPARGPFLPPPPALSAGERLILTVPEGLKWQPLSIAPDGNEAAYTEGDAGRVALVWKAGRLDGLDRVENECLWKEGRTPVLRVWRGGQVHLAEGKVIWEPYTSITEPILSPNRRDVACIARDKNKTVVIAQGSKSDVITIYETSLGYTPSNQIGYAATVPTTDPTQTITGYFLDRTTRQLPGSGLGIVTEPPSFSEDGSRVAYAQVNAVCFDGAVGPSFLKVFAPRLSADGRALAYFARFGPAGVSDKNAKAALVIGITPGVKFDDVAGVPMMSRDGKTIAYLAKRGTKWLVVQGTRPGPEYDLIKPRVYDVDQPVVSPDGKVVAYTAERGALQAVVVNGKEIDTQPNLSAPFLSADGKNVSYGFVTGPYFIWKTQPIPR